jgi:cytochrome c peroxidase
MPQRSVRAKDCIAAIGLLVMAATSTTVAACPKYLTSGCAQWQSSVLPEKPPPAHGNAFADRDDAAALGMKVFYDNRFSLPSSGVSCASCHDPEHSFSENKARSHTIREVARNAPDLVDAAWYKTAHFWDGKVDSLWSAPLFTFEQADEMGSSRLHVVHVLAAIYKVRYEGVFGHLPDLSDTKRFPDSGKPGMQQFDAMSDADKATVNQIYANVGKALEAYIRKLAAGRAPFDDFMNGSEKSLTPGARRGMAAFTQHGCGTCHSGPTFTDEKFHKLGLPQLPGRAEDLGREAGAAMARHWEFNSNSRFADPGTVASPPAKGKASGEKYAFRTPSLRNVGLTGPYGHDGTLQTLDQAIDAHARILPVHSAITAQERSDIVELLRSLNGRPPLPPWNYWPGG